MSSHIGKQAIVIGAGMPIIRSSASAIRSVKETNRIGIWDLNAVNQAL